MLSDVLVLNVMEFTATLATHFCVQSIQCYQLCLALMLLFNVSSPSGPHNQTQMSQVG